MRKVLLTTTALVGLGGVSAASAIEISGQYEFLYTNADNGTAMSSGQNTSSFSSDANIDFKGSTTTDSGLTFGGMVRLETNSGAAIEDQGLYISGDFGYIMMGATDGVVDNMDDFMNASAYSAYGDVSPNATVNDDTQLGDSESTAKVGYRSPEVSGFQVGFSLQDAGTASKADHSEMMVTYNMGPVKVGYGSSETPNATGTGADTSMTQYGIGGSMNGFTFAYALGTDKVSNVSGTSGNSSKIDTSDALIAYEGIENVAIYYQLIDSEEKTGTNAGDKADTNEVGIYYTVAPGVSALLSQTAQDFSDAGGTANETNDVTYFGLTVKF